MATILNKLPRELRDQIYRELLVDDVNGIDVFNWGYLIKQKQLSPAILQVSKQVFFEASMIFYEENTFRINNLLYCAYPDLMLSFQGHTNEILFPQDFGKIKHLEVVYKDGESFNINRSIDLMDKIARTGCSLKTLRVSWDFRDFDLSSAGFKAETCMIPGNKRFPRAVAGLKVQNKIMITLNSNDLGHRGRFEAFASQMGSLMQRATMRATKECIKKSVGVDGEVSEEVQAYEEEEILVEESDWNQSEDEISDTYDGSVAYEITWVKRYDDTRIYYVWTWTLVPTATMVLDEGSKSAKQLD